MSVMSLEILTPEKNIVYQDVEYVSLPSREGECGVLPHHADTIIALEKGVLSYDKNNQRHTITITNGFAQVCYTGVTILVEAMEIE